LHISQLPLPGGAPPTDSVVSFLGWAVAILVGGIAALWLKHEKDKAAQFKELIDAYKDEAEKRQDRVTELERQVSDLHAQRLADERRSADEAKRIARMLLRQSRGMAPDSEPPDDDEFANIPTGVAHEVIAAQVPRPAEPYRPRQKSHQIIEVNQTRQPRKPR